MKIKALIESTMYSQRYIFLITNVACVFIAINEGVELMNVLIFFARIQSLFSS